MSSPTPATFTIALNGADPVQVTVPDVSVPLLYVLRNHFGLKGPKFGCGFGQCGACEVNLLGQAARSCQATIEAIQQLMNFYGIPLSYPIAVTTLEGLGTASSPHPLQSAFIDQQAGQCAYCANAMIMGAYSWLEGRIAAGNTAVPTDSEVEDFLSNSVYTDPITGQVTPTPYLCRCGAHTRFVLAIQEAAKGMA
jgi:aerobic-type carbon monoxide dehydrogenase small subunit (CoxS/CutS family)